MLNNDDSFNSIDRLMEFGLGIAVARQMIDTMNYTMENMRMPGVGNPLSAQPAQYYALVNNSQCGPMSLDEVASLIGSGSIKKDSLMWKVGSQAWCKAESLPEVLKHFLLLNKE